MAEVAFATIASRGRAMMHRANLSLNMRDKLCKEAFRTATLLDSLTVIIINNVAKTRVEYWSGTLPKFANYLRTWGEAETIALRKNRSVRGMRALVDGSAFLTTNLTNVFSYYVITEFGKVVVRPSVQHLIQDNLEYQVIQDRLKEFDDATAAKGDSDIVTD